MWGMFCCKYEEETFTFESIDGCDGSELSVNSTCCKDNEQVKCGSKLGCKNRRGKLFWHICIGCDSIKITKSFSQLLTFIIT